MNSISEAERQQRRIAVESTIGTHAMEGQHPDDQTLSMMKSYAEGKLSLEEFSAAMQSHATTVLDRVRARALAGAA